jgi:hypothetical protein
MTHGLQSKVLHVFAHEELGVPVYSHHGELLRVTHVAGGRGSGRAVAASFTEKWFAEKWRFKLPNSATK